MIIQARFGENCGTAEELFQLIPAMKPAATSYFQPRVGRGWKTGLPLDGHYQILNMDHLLQLPRFEWEPFYHLPDVAEHGVKGALQKSRQEGGRLQSVAPAYVPYIPNTFTVSDAWVWPQY